MHKGIQLVVLLKNLATGFVAPVLTLALLAHGATLQNVSLLIGAYSFTVIAAEFPSGLFADLYGRKNAFLVSALCCLMGYALLLVSRNLATLLAAMALYGLGRAFSSGSMDALAMDAAADDTALVKTASRLAVLESLGLSTGALAGGALAGLGKAYAGNLAASLAVTLVMFVIALLGVQEPHRARNPHRKERPDGPGFEPDRKPLTFGALMRESLRFAAKPGLVRALFLFSICTGFAMLGVETYWQPALQSFAPPAWLFGVVSFMGFASVMAGSRLVERVLVRRPQARYGCWLLLKALLAMGLLLLVISRGMVTFAGAYMLTYLLLGGGGVAENILLNREAPASQRASILSLFSFALQIGGVAASVTGFLLGTGNAYRTLWLLAVGLLLCAASLAALPTGRHRHSKTGNA